MSKAAYRYPPDEFDAPPDPDAPRGVHRAPRSAWSRWWPFLAVIVIVPLVAWGAVTLLAQRGQLPDLPGLGEPTSSEQASGPASETPGDTPTSTGPSTASAPASQAPATTSAAPATDLTVPVTVLNGAKINGLAKKIGNELTAAGFTAVTPGNATSSSPASSTVFYGSDDLKATAELVASTIKVAAVVQSPSDAPSGITVVLRSDPNA